MGHVIDYSRYQTLRITRRGANQTVLDIQMKAGGPGGNGKPEWPKGYSCIAEKRAIETILDGKPSTEFMKFGDTIRIEMKGKDGQSVFGAIDQQMVPLEA